MKKKILSIIVTICLISAVFPMSSTSIKAVDHVHCTCGQTDCSGYGHNPTQEWQKWSVDNELPVDDGYYYLTCDVEVTSEWSLRNSDMNICLNGHDIDIDTEDEYGICANKNTTLVITDCDRQPGTVYAGGDYLINITNNTNVTLNNVNFEGYDNTSLFFVDEGCSLEGNSIEGSATLTGVKDGMINRGSTVLEACDFDIQTKSDSAIIYNHGGTLFTGHNTMYLDGLDGDDNESRGVMNDDGTWYSSHDDIVCESVADAFAVQGRGTANTYIAGSHLKAVGFDDAFGLQVGEPNALADDQDKNYIYGDANIEGTDASIQLNHLGGLFAANEEISEKFEGSLVTIYNNVADTHLGDVIVQKADDTMLDKFSLVYPANTYLKLDGTNLISTNEEPTTTVAPTTTTTAAPTSSTVVPSSEEPSSEEPSSEETSVEPSTEAPTVAPSSSEAPTVAPSTEAPTVAPSTEAPTQAPTVAPTSKEETTKGEVVTTKPTVKSVKIKKIKKAKKSAKVIWKTLTSKDATGYQIRYSLKKNMKKAKKKFVKKVTIGSVKIKKLKRKKRYYFQIRAYLDWSNERLYSVWSKKKSGKIK